MKHAHGEYCRVRGTGATIHSTKKEERKEGNKQTAGRKNEKQENRLRIKWTPKEGQGRFFLYILHF
jgi:hypothetical protein